MFANELDVQGWYLNGRIGAGRFFPSITMRDTVRSGKWAGLSPFTAKGQVRKSRVSELPRFFGYLMESMDGRVWRPLAMTREFQIWEILGIKDSARLVGGLVEVSRGALTTRWIIMVACKMGLFRSSKPNGMGNG
jgi:hypothetical protein